MTASATPTWHRIPRDLPADGACVVVRDSRLGERIGRWDAGAHEWWGTHVDGREVDWRASMYCFEEWRVKC